MGGKGKKRGQIGKILASEAIPAAVWGGGKEQPPFPLSKLPLVFPFSLNAEPGNDVSLFCNQTLIKHTQRFM